jgi:iron complex outermembrane recepter protein
MRFRAFNTLAGASLVVFASAATAQTGASPGASDAGFELEEIVVTARRKDESLQDVPTTINAVTGAEIEKLNIRKFEDIASVVPGLSLSSNANGIGGIATVRGVAYDVNASGNNGTIEFYMNDAPISAGNLFQTMYDVQQVELLRGPQGTLRGRASPSGSMTVATRRPNLQDIGGYVSGTGTSIGGYNGQGAFNFPIISDVLAVRVAGAYDKNEGNRVTSLNSTLDPESKTKSGRVTVRFEPTDSLSFTLTAQKTKQDITTFDQVESQQSVLPGTAVNPGAPGATYSPPYITAGDRLAVEDAPRVITQDFNNYNFQAQWAFAGQKLNYVGARNEQSFNSVQITDTADFFPTNYPVFTHGYGQVTDSKSYTLAHELRLSSEERIAGIFDYIVGAFYQNANFPTKLTIATPVLFGAPSPTVAGLINKTPIVRNGGNKEISGFANITAHVTDADEVSAGARYIKYQSHGTLLINGALQSLATEDSDFHTTIFSVSGKHNFSDDLMVYATVGSSWRPGISATGDFSIAQSALERSFIVLGPEKSTSYELGLKGSALEKRLRYSASVYHQKFKDFPYRSSSGVFYVETQASGIPRVNSFNFVAAVPVEVNGLEASIDFAATPSWDMGVSGALSKGEIKDGFVPCNDYSPRDGVPDSSGSVPTIAGIQAATGGGTISGCTVTQSASLAPQWSGSLQSEYRIPITSAFNSFVRGQASIYGNSKNDPTNSVDDYKSYALLNLYLGLRESTGVWEVSVYGKNVTNTERVLARSSTVQTTNYNIVQNGFTGLTNYFGGMSMTAPREFGVNVRYAFGAK